MSQDLDSLFTFIEGVLGSDQSIVFDTPAYKGSVARLSTEGGYSSTPTSGAPVRGTQTAKNGNPDEGREPQGIVLEYPPSQNASICPVKIGRRVAIVHTAAANRWIKENRLRVKEAELTPFVGKVEVTILLYPKDNRQDIDAGLKKALDILQVHPDSGGSGMYLNDRQVRRIVQIYCDPDKEDPRIEIRVAPI